MALLGPQHASWAVALVGVAVGQPEQGKQVLLRVNAALDDLAVGIPPARGPELTSLRVQRGALTGHQGAIGGTAGAGGPGGGGGRTGASAATLLGRSRSRPSRGGAHQEV